MPENDELRQRIIEGLAHRYTLCTRADRAGFIIEEINEPTRLPNFKCEAGPAVQPKCDAAQDAQAVVDRVQLELNAIEQAGLTAYFLLVADCARYGRSIGATWVARGAAPGSLVNYILGVSNADPMRHGLLFERFLNVERVTPPPIYLEFADDRLDEVIEYVRKKWDGNQVAHLVTDLESDLAADLPTLGLLGLKSLSVLRRTCECVRQTMGIEVLIDHLPLDDVKTYELLSSGDTTGVFLLEDEELRDLCRKLQPTSVAHVSALISQCIRWHPFGPAQRDSFPTFSLFVTGGRASSMHTRPWSQSRGRPTACCSIKSR